MDVAKAVIQEEGFKDVLFDRLREYDYVFDALLDDDVALYTNEIEQPKNVFTLSITNNAKQLICAVPPNLYRWVIDISRKLSEEVTDLYNPTGCWSPTFKASYNDVAMLVHCAMKYIGNKVQLTSDVRSFYISFKDDVGLDIKLHEF